ncbi:cytochrome c nitrite reductase small subunit [bacterium]|nr:cytochrome c nitrite reductase small subunit [bacterium]
MFKLKSWEHGFIRIPVLWLVVAFGVAAGAGGYTFFYAQGLSYLQKDSAACKNCHIMKEHYDAWSRTTHHAVASCNDCHTPHDLIGKYTVKAINGWNHSAAFTTGNFHEPIQIKGFNKEILQHNCIRCHQSVVGRMGAGTRGENTDCMHCHSDVGHNRRK